MIQTEVQLITVKLSESRVNTDRKAGKRLKAGLQKNPVHLNSKKPTEKSQGNTITSPSINKNYSLEKSALINMISSTPHS